MNVKETDSEEKFTDHEEIYRLNYELKEANRKLELLKRWFNSFQELEDYLLKAGIWSEQDIDKENPVNTIINGFKRYLQNSRGCCHSWEQLEGDRRQCISCDLTQYWHPDGHYNDVEVTTIKQSFFFRIFKGLKKWYKSTDYIDHRTIGSEPENENEVFKHGGTPL